MKKTLVMACALLALTAGMASAQAGINLSWSDCGSTGTQDQAFACDTNTGFQTVFGSFIPPAGITALAGNDIVIDLQTSGAVLSDWWRFDFGGCHYLSLSSDFNFTAGPFACT